MPFIPVSSIKIQLAWLGLGSKCGENRVAGVPE
jgi:hypothetical protein